MDVRDARGEYRIESVSAGAPHGIPRGYKRTEMGIIPDDWTTEGLLTIAESLDNKRIPLNADQRARMQGDIPYCGANGILDYVNDFLFDEDIVLIAEDGGYFDEFATRPIAYRVTGKSWVNNHAHVLKARKGHDKGFLFWSLVHKNILPFLASGTRAKLNKSEMRKILVAVPPTDHEQGAIAEALSDADALLGALDQLIAKKRDLKQAAMQQLLTGQTRLPGFTQDWETKRLDQLGFVYGGLTGKTKEDFGQGSARYVTFMNVMSNVVLDCGAFDRVRVLPSESQNRVLKGDLLFNGSSETPEEVAMCAVLASEVPVLYLNSFCFGFRLHGYADADGLFLAYCLRSKEGRELVKSLAQGSTRYNVSKTAFLKAALRVPAGEEQTAIAVVLSDMDAEIKALEARRAKTRDMKQAMMQELLTGKTRLV